jgi:hypothetical protein
MSTLKHSSAGPHVVVSPPGAHSCGRCMLQGFVPGVSNLEGSTKLQVVNWCAPFHDFAGGQQVRSSGCSKLSPPAPWLWLNIHLL